MLAKDYDRKAREAHWGDYWETEGVYRFDPERLDDAYVIDNPPRYASGPLHMGHAAHYTHIDFAARYQRIKGKNVLFPLCFDVNGMPIEVNVEKKFGIKMWETPRQEFLKLCSDFAGANIDEMTRQFRILGQSMDASVYYQTDAPYYRRLTQISFLRLFQKDLVYRGEFPIYWCPRCTTALAQSEVAYEDRTTKLNFVKFFKTDGEPILVATTRPELIASCQCVALHPDDPRIADLEGGTLRTPVFEKEVPIIKDDAVDPAFGTGVVMICTIGDKEDLNWVRKYNLPIEKAIDERGLMTELAGKYQGMHLEDARKAIIEDMRVEGLLVDQKDTLQNVGGCWRCSTPIEFLVSKQWFLKILPFKELVMETAREAEWFPKHMFIRLKEWVDSLAWDWVISRQRYFATPIPIWQCTGCDHVALAEEGSCYIDPTVTPPPYDDCPDCGSPMKGCEEVFDTWMDSSLTPLYNSFWLRDDEKFAKLYPNSLRPQSHDIIRTWAFYSLLRGKLLTDVKPFETFMIDGFILAVDGTPMHASKGNVINPLEILETEGADPLRYYAGTCAVGEDNPFRPQDVTRGKYLTNKYYNVQRFIESALKDHDGSPLVMEDLQVEDRWLLSKLGETVERVDETCAEFRFDQGLKAADGFLWHTLADHYLEMVKQRIYGDGDVTVRRVLHRVGLDITKLLCIYFPHITEEVYQEVYRRWDGLKSIHVAPFPEVILRDAGAIAEGEVLKDLIAEIRSWKAAQKLSPAAPLKRLAIACTEEQRSIMEPSEATIRNTLKVDELEFISREDIREVWKAPKPVFSQLGPAFKGEARVVAAAITSLGEESMEQLSTGDPVMLDTPSGPVEVTPEMVELQKGVELAGASIEVIPFESFMVGIEK